jgi:hypothetical protein
MCTVQRFVFYQHWSEAVETALSPWALEGSTRSISDYRPGTASHQNILEGTKETPSLQRVGGPELPTFSASSPISFAGEADNFSGATEAD